MLESVRGSIASESYGQIAALVHASTKVARQKKTSEARAGRTRGGKVVSLANAYADCFDSRGEKGDAVDAGDHAVGSSQDSDENLDKSEVALCSTISHHQKQITVQVLVQI